MLAAALFDLDGTLVDTEPRSQAAWRRLFRAHGVGLDESLLASFAGRPGKTVLVENLRLFPDGSTVDGLFAEAMSYATDVAEPMPGAVELVRALHEIDCPIGVVTSGTRDYAHAELNALGVRALFDTVITAEDVSRGKPDPEGYLLGCARLGVEPARTVVFEDAPAGIAAAKAAGTFCVAIGADGSAADLVVADWAEVRVPFSLEFDGIL
ncbi:HAD family phosphatase [Amycolatopsis sp. NPDC004079]|uniref:HAD family hydrolase n=1 Tax=Amycolatopsis sp. NPDC004079 TaxID=3154549 RepID=UPI0033B983A7